MFENSDFTDEDIRDLDDTERGFMLRELGKHPALIETFHPMNKEAKRLFQMLNRMDTETRAKQNEAAQTARELMPETKKQITAIEQSKAFIDRLHPEHKRVHKEWLNLFAEPAGVQ